MKAQPEQLSSKDLEKDDSINNNMIKLTKLWKLENFKDGSFNSSMMDQPLSTVNFLPYKSVSFSPTICPFDSSQGSLEHELSFLKIAQHFYSLHPDMIIWTSD